MSPMGTVKSLRFYCGLALIGQEFDSSTLPECGDAKEWIVCDGFCPENPGNHEVCLYAMAKTDDEWSNLPYIAASLGRIDYLELAFELGMKVGDWAVYGNAINYGQLETLKYLHKKFAIVFSELDTARAARFGHIHILEYLRQNGCPWNHRAPWDAAENGHVHVLKYLHEHGCPFSRRATQFAAMNGHFECLKFAFEKGYPMELSSLEAAAKNGYIRCFKFICEHKPELVLMIPKLGIGWFRSKTIRKYIRRMKYI